MPRSNTRQRLPSPTLWLLAGALVVTLTARADARSLVGTPGHPFGLGGILGQPTGVSIKYFFDHNQAFDAAMGAGFLGGSAFQLHGDYLYHFFLHRGRNFDLPLYIGVGVRFNAWFDKKGKHYFGSDKHGRAGIAFRVPIGIAWHLRRVPLDPFAEAVPGIGVLPGPGVAVDVAVGVRYYF